MSRRLTVEHSYSKKMLESGDNQIKKKGVLLMLGLQTDTAQSREAAARLRVWGRNGRGDMAAGYRRAQARHNGVEWVTGAWLAHLSR